MHQEVELSTIGGDNLRSKSMLANRQFLIAKRLIAALPLVPTNDLTYNLLDDIQAGFYDDLGEAEDNWDAWVQRTVELLVAEGRLMPYDIGIYKPAIEHII